MKPKMDIVGKGIYSFGSEHGMTKGNSVVAVDLYNRHGTTEYKKNVEQFIREHGGSLVGFEGESSFDSTAQRYFDLGRRGDTFLIKTINNGTMLMETNWEDVLEFIYKLDSKSKGQPVGAIGGLLSKYASKCLKDNSWEKYFGVHENQLAIFSGCLTDVILKLSRKGIDVEIKDGLTIPIPSEKERGPERSSRYQFKI